MKKFLLITKSESCDDYSYLIEHPTKPTHEELDKFLDENACDRDEERHYENVVDVVHLEGDFQTLRKEPTEDDMLAAMGWGITCQSPHEIEHEDGSSARGQATQMVIDAVIEEYKDL